jgi:hypothetical protein
MLLFLSWFLFLGAPWPQGTGRNTGTKVVVRITSGDHISEFTILHDGRPASNGVPKFRSAAECGWRVGIRRPARKREHCAVRSGAKIWAESKRQRVCLDALCVKASSSRRCVARRDLIEYKI